MEDAPWVVGLIFLVLGSIFLTPIILLVGIIWYKLRKTRLQNEAVLELAERVSCRRPRPSMPSCHGRAAGASGRAAAPYQQAVASRRRAVWSDLRKGVILRCVGLALSLYSMTERAASPTGSGWC